MLLSYALGHKQYPIHYDLKTIFIFTFAAIAIFFSSRAIELYCPGVSPVASMAVNTVFLLIYFGAIVVYLRKRQLNKS